MRVQFSPPEKNAPERLVAQAELHFDDSDLSELKLTGFAIWRSAEGELYLTLPSRAFGAGTERRYFEYLRTVNADVEALKAFKARILDSYRERVTAVA
jgi:hypothetical protein